MTTPDNLSQLIASSVYQFPRYYAIGYQWNTKEECDFIEACLEQYRHRKGGHLLDIGCGAGRHLLEFARRGYQASGLDLRQEMVSFVHEEAKKAKLNIEASVGDLRDMRLTGTFDVAICLMDTFRYLLTNEQIIHHLQTVVAHLAPQGLYIADFWAPTQWDQLANEIHQWEQTQDGTTVKVFYVQHPDSVDPVHQTFEDELVFQIEEQGGVKEIHGERVRTRLIMPQEFRALVAASGVFEVAGTFAEFDLAKPYEQGHLSWRMISVLKKRGR